MVLKSLEFDLLKPAETRALMGLGIETQYIHALTS